MRLVGSPVIEAAEAAEAADAARALNTAGGIYEDIRDWTEVWKKYAGKVEVMLMLLYKTEVVETVMPGKLDKVVGSKVP